MVFFFHSIDTEDEHDFYLQEDRLQLSGLQGFSLGYRVTWPVSLVLDRKTITLYQMIFRHLFFCKHVEKMLCRLVLFENFAHSYVNGVTVELFIYIYIFFFFL